MTATSQNTCDRKRRHAPELQKRECLWLRLRFGTQKCERNMPSRYGDTSGMRGKVSAKIYLLFCCSHFVRSAPLCAHAQLCLQIVDFMSVSSVGGPSRPSRSWTQHRGNTGTAKTIKGETKHMFLNKTALFVVAASGSPRNRGKQSDGIFLWWKTTKEHIGHSASACAVLRWRRLRPEQCVLTRRTCTAFSRRAGCFTGTRSAW